MNDWQQRVVLERDELQEKINQLYAMLAKGKPEYIGNHAWQLLCMQYGAMQQYRNILDQRILTF